MEKMNVINTLPALFEKIDKLESEGLFSGKRVYLWGMQKAAYIASQYMAEKGINIIAILDSNPEQQGEISAKLKSRYAEKAEMYVKSPEVLKTLENKENIVILVFSKAFSAIKETAVSYGIIPELCIKFYSTQDNLNSFRVENKTLIQMDERKKIQYDLLKYLKGVCERNQLRFYLAAGTLLGAVRHQGYIPWDDDIDVYMPWKDYTKLIELFESKREGTPQHSLLYHGICENFTWVYAKLQDNRTISYGVRYPLICEIGVNIDIFPMGGFPDEPIKQAEKKEEIYAFLGKWKKHLTYFNYNPDFEFRNAAEHIEHIFSEYDYDSCKTVGYFINACWDWELNSYSSYSKEVGLKFEDDVFPAPAGYDEVLKNRYDEYMKLPPECQRKAPHAYKSYWR